MNSSRVSVIIPAYNYAAYIGQTLESLQTQTFAGWQCVVVDDGSTDDTPEIVRSHAMQDARFTLIPLQNGGPSAARNAGIRESTGEYLQFLDADDLLEPRKFEHQVAYLDEHPEVDFVYGPTRYFRNEFPDERTLSIDGGDFDWTTENSASGKTLIDALLRSNLTTIHAPLVRRGLIEQIGGFNEAMRYMEDWDLWLRGALHGARYHFLQQDDTMALTRSHGVSLSRARIAMLQGQVQMRESIHARLDDAELRALNQALLFQAQTLLRFEQALAEPHWPRRYRRLLHSIPPKARFKWLVYALTLPVLRGRLRPLLQKIRTVRKRRG
ncbi:MAG TPA: glycosyltransferase [Abditibacteriaceae bacterium]